MKINVEITNIVPAAEKLIAPFQTMQERTVTEIARVDVLMSSGGDIHRHPQPITASHPPDIADKSENEKTIRSRDFAKCFSGNKLSQSKIGHS